MARIIVRTMAVIGCLCGSSIHAASPKQILNNLLNGFLPQSELLTATPTPVCVVGTTLYFNSYDTTYGWELWKSNGTAAGTVPVRDRNADLGSISATNLTAVGNTLYFTAYDGINGTELWKSDGTTAGTVLVKDIHSGSSSSGPSNLTAVDSSLYFTADDGINGTELWKSDGTAAGTVLVKDIVAGSSSSGPSNLTAVGTTLYFGANDINGVELWRSNGTTVSTVRVKSIFSGPSSLSDLTAVGSTLFFKADASGGVSELWKSDGTTNGTVGVIRLMSSVNTNLECVGNALFFTESYSLWNSDGTTDGTVLVKSFLDGDFSQREPDNLTAMGNTLYFTASDKKNGPRLWKSDGTPDGTNLIQNIRFFPYKNLDPASLIVAEKRIFFTASSGSGDLIETRQVWVSDGSIEGTRQIEDLAFDSIGDTPFILAFAAVMQLYQYEQSMIQNRISQMSQRTLSYLINPEIDEIPDQTVTSGFSIAALPFAVWPGSDDFPVSASSSDQTLVRDADIILGGSGEDRTVTVKSAANVSGTAIITLTVSNGSSTTNIATESFALTITPGKPQNFSASFTPKGKPVTDGQATRQFGSVKRTQKAGVIRNLTLTNTGTKPLTGLKILKDGEAAADFIIKGLNPKPLAPRRSLTFELVFRPKNVGTRQAAIHLFSSETPDNPFDLTLSGTGVAAPKKRE